MFELAREYRQEIDQWRSLLQHLPQVLEFRVEPQEIYEGETAKLSWVTRNASKVWIESDKGERWEVQPTGSMEVSPKETTTYTIHVE